jgi:hypothetical protein
VPGPLDCAYAGAAMIAAAAMVMIFNMGFASLA